MNAEDRNRRMLIGALAILRASQFVLWLGTALVNSPEIQPPWVKAVCVLAAGWSAGLFWLALRRNAVTPTWVVADVLPALGYAVAVCRAFDPATMWPTHNQVVAPLCGVAVTAAVFLVPRWAALAVSAVIAAWMIGTWPAVTAGTGAAVFQNVAMIAVFSSVAGATSHMLTRAAREADRSAERAVRAERGRATAEARDKERNRQFGVLHDTVLHTLESIARGVLPTDSAQARQACRRDSEYLRGLITSGPGDIPSDLGAALATMVRGHSGLGETRVKQQFDELPVDVPPPVIEAITGAVREALNNAVKHAGTGTLWLTGVGEGEAGVRLTVVDRGCGFDAATVHQGFGLGRSIRQRIEGVGGQVRIDSALGEGTTVEITWNP